MHETKQRPFVLITSIIEVILGFIAYGFGFLMWKKKIRWKLTYIGILDGEEKLVMRIKSQEVRCRYFK